MIATEELFDVIDGTWPAARYVREGPWLLREGQGGGKRVSAASTRETVTPDDIATAVAGMAALGQPPLFMVAEGQGALDAQLAMLGYVSVDASVAYAAPVEALTQVPLPRVTVLTHWEPLAIDRDIWQAGGIGPERVNVMMRASGPRTAFLGRHDNKPAGAAFAAIHGRCAMLHALEILPHQRRQGMGRWFMRAAAFWAQEHGAELLTVICTRANTAANALYASLGMQPVGGYHYRHRPDRKDTT